MVKKHDLTGQKFGRLTATSEETHKRAPDGRSIRLIKCICDCGNTHFAQAKHLNNGDSKSCGCLNHDRITSGINYKHGHSREDSPSKEYRTWLNMKQRCYNPNSSFFHRYGGRRISMCSEWLESFESFLSDMGEAPSEKHSIDRIDNDGNYCKENCRWATNTEQRHNKPDYIKPEVRLKAKQLRDSGMSLNAVADTLGISQASVRNIHLGIY